MIYTFLGGYFAVAYTDFFQSIVMLVGMVWIFIATLNAVGGFTAANNAIAQIDPTYLSMWGKDLAHKGAWPDILGAVLIFSVGYMDWPHVVTRHMAMKSPRTARMAGVYSTIWNIFFVTAPYMLGIFAIILLPNLADPEVAIFTLAGELLPAAVTGIVMAAIMAAIMSTADSILLQVGGALVAYLSEITSFILPPMVAGLVASWILMILVSLATQKSSPVPEYIHKAMDLTAEVGPIPKGILTSAEFDLSPEAMVVKRKLDK